MPRLRKISFKLLAGVVIAHILIIGCAVMDRQKKAEDENMFRVRIGGEELSHGEEVGRPERKAPGRLPEPEPEPDPVPEEPAAEPAPPPPPAPREPGIDYEALNRAKQKKAAEEKKRKAELEKKKKEIARKKWLEKRKRLEAEKKRKAELEKKKKEIARKKWLEKKRRLEAEKRRKTEEAKRKAEAERKRKERESVYQPDQSGPIGGGGTNLNPNVPVGSKDRAQAYGKQDNRTPGGGASVKLTEYANRSLLPYLKSRWKQPPDSLLGGKRPSVDIVLTISANGKVQQASIKRPSGVAAMDDSVKRLLKGLDILPRPPDGEISLAITLQTE